VASGNFFGGEFFGGGFFGANTPTTTTTTGGYFDYGRRRDPDDIRRSREKFGVIPPQAQSIIDAVAERQTQDLRLDEQQRLEELAGELKLAGIEYQSHYLELLNDQRQRMIDAEIGRRIMALQEENAIRLLIMVSTL